MRKTPPANRKLLILPTKNGKIRREKKIERKAGDFPRLMRGSYEIREALRREGEAFVRLGIA
jgi:hypothetical protein